MSGVSSQSSPGSPTPSGTLLPAGAALIGVAGGPPGVVAAGLVGLVAKNLRTRAGSERRRFEEAVARALKSAAAGADPDQKVIRQSDRGKPIQLVRRLASSSLGFKAWDYKSTASEIADVFFDPDYKVPNSSEYAALLTHAFYDEQLWKNPAATPSAAAQIPSTNAVQGIELFKAAIDSVLEPFVQSLAAVIAYAATKNMQETLHVDLSTTSGTATGDVEILADWVIGAAEIIARSIQIDAQFGDLRRSLVDIQILGYHQDELILLRRIASATEGTERGLGVGLRRSVAVVVVLLFLDLVDWFDSTGAVADFLGAVVERIAD